MKNVLYMLALCGMVSMVSVGCGSSSATDTGATGTGKLVKVKLPNMT